MTHGNYADVNGLHLYYELHGPENSTNPPLVLLHGGFGATSMFADLIPELARSRQVIAVDLQAHGRTADIDRPLHFESMADDIAALLHHLSISQADVLGYSLGGGTALRTAIQHPEMVRKLVVVAFPLASQGWLPDVRQAMRQLGPHAAEGMKQSPMYQLYASLAPKVEDWPRLVTQVSSLVPSDYDWTPELSRIQAAVMLVAGDADSISPVSMAQYFSLLGGGQRDGGWDNSGVTRHRLAILPKTTHYDILQSPSLLPVVTAFLTEA